MAITDVYARVNLATSKLDLRIVNGTGAITTGTVRVTAPDGQYYYAFGTISNFVAYTGTLTASASTTTSWFASIDLPLDINLAVQLGLYKVDINYNNGGNLSYTGALSTAGFTYAFCSIPVPTPNATVDCINGQAIFGDITGYGYTVNNAIPVITRTMIVEKMGGLPADNTPPLEGWDEWTYTGSTTTIPDSGAVLAYPYLYSGVGENGYRVNVAVTLLYDFGTFFLYTESTKESYFDVTCEKGICDLFCGINTLKLQFEATAEGSPQYEYLKNKLLMITLYRTLFLEAYRCGSEDVKISSLNKIREIGAFTSNCCGDTENFQISPYKLCDCDSDWKERPLTNASTQAPSGYAYKIGDKAYDANFTYLYVNTGVWERQALQVAVWDFTT